LLRRLSRYTKIGSNCSVRRRASELADMDENEDTELGIRLR
jgi:hypothetical protein